MNRNELQNEYFNWMINKIFTDEELKNSYYCLLLELYSIPFQWSLPMDENRARDAQDFRYDFGYEMDISEHDVCIYLDDVEPSLLETIIKLICRVQDNMIGDIEPGLSNQEIFMDILNSLGISDMTGEIEEGDRYTLSCMIDTLYNRSYCYNGEGGLFTVNNPKQDMRQTEIWYQFMWYLDEKIGGNYL